MQKHAYLIMSHNDFYILEKLLRLLDDRRNDIYVHIDKKVKNFDFKYFKKICKHSEVKFIKRIKVYWGGYSQVQCELNLLEEAIKNNYEYYHLLSGVDLPLKNQDNIHIFFKQNNGKEFIRFSQNKWDYDRVAKINLLSDYNKTNNKFKLYMYISINKFISKLINRRNYDYTEKFPKYKFMKGDNCFSITNECAHYICQNKHNIRKMFKYAIGADEHFIHTIVYNSKFKEKISFNTCLREIDWDRGNPYIYKIQDFKLLISSENLFARKFNSNVDKNIVDKICDYLFI